MNTLLIDKRNKYKQLSNGAFCEFLERVLGLYNTGVTLGFAVDHNWKLLNKSDPVCEKGSYRLFNCMYLATCNLTCECDITLKFGPYTPNIALWHGVM